MVRGLALALALATSNAFLSGTTLRQRAAPMRMSAAAPTTTQNADYLTGAGAISLGQKARPTPTADSQRRISEAGSAGGLAARLSARACGLRRKGGFLQDSRSVEGAQIGSGIWLKTPCV